MNDLKKIVLSHKEDLDGIAAAALMVQARGCEPKLVDYQGMMGALKKLAGNPDVGELYVCDLGVSESNSEEFITIIGKLCCRMPVTYIDHHAIGVDAAERLSDAGVRMVHDTRDCAAVLAYGEFAGSMSDNASFVAACAAVSDYMEKGPAASNLMHMYDRQFVQISAAVLNYCVAGSQRDKSYLKRLVSDLAASKYPHEIPGSFELARGQVAPFPEMIRTIRRNVVRLRHVAHMDMTEPGYKRAANFVLGLGGRDVAVTYRLKEDHYQASVRGADWCGVHLGRMVGEVAAELGGSGGGHAKACGAIIPPDKIDVFVKELDRRVGLNPLYGGEGD